MTYAMEQRPMISQPGPRMCANCACFAAMTPEGDVLDPDTAPAELQRVCQRSTPGGRMARVEVPVFDPKTGAPVMRRAGEQRTEARQVLQIGYPPTVATARCFDGWRPLGTLPGENYKLANVERVLLPMCAQIAAGNSQAAKKLAEGLLADLLAANVPTIGKPS